MRRSVHHRVLFILLLAAAGVFPPGMLLAENSNASQALIAAVQHNDSATLGKLIASGHSLNVQDAEGWTALMFAVQAGNLQMISSLLKAGASANIGDRLGRTPLHLAVERLADITRQLIDAGANVNARNAGGITVLMTAAGNGRRDLVETLLEAGARLDFKDYQGNSILDWSGRSGNRALTDFLQPKLARAVADAPEESGEDFLEDKYADAVHPAWFKLSYLDLDEDLNDALRDGKKGLMVYFGLKRCSYCQAFMDNTLSQTDIARRLQGLFDAVGLDIFSDNDMTDPGGRAYVVKDFVTAKKANYSPTMIFYGPKGKQLLKIVGYYPPDKFRRVLDYLEGDHYKTETLYTYINRHKSTTGTKALAIRKDPLFGNENYTLYRKDKAAHRPLMVLFEQPDCDACERFHQRVLTDKPIRRLLGRFDTLQLDSTDTRTAVVTPRGSRIAAKTWYHRLGLNYSPAMVFFDEQGKEIMRLDSETKRWRMEGTLQLILAKDYKQDTQVQRWRRDKALLFYHQQQATN